MASFCFMYDLVKDELTIQDKRRFGVISIEAAEAHPHVISDDLKSLLTVRQSDDGESHPE